MVVIPTGAVVEVLIAFQSPLVCCIRLAVFSQQQLRSEALADLASALDGNEDDDDDDEEVRQTPALFTDSTNRPISRASRNGGRGTAMKILTTLDMDTRRGAVRGRSNRQNWERKFSWSGISTKRNRATRKLNSKP